MLIVLFQMVLFLLFFIIHTYADIHAVLMAGSMGYVNYRHQSDVSRAYQLLTKSGVNPQNIITMLYDDIANNIQNPFPNKLFNVPSNVSNPGIDVYQGLKKDYVGNTVNANNFISVLTGNSSAVPLNHPVLQSGSNDRVFVAFFDHGGIDIIGTPVAPPYITRKALLNAFDFMYHQKKYHELIFYVEACFGGSMVVNMPTNRNIYVVTAANAHQSSYGTFCPPNDVVDYNGSRAHIGACLSDLFSVNWMNNLARFLHRNETLLEQFKRVKQKTMLSNVSMYGDILFDKESIHDFERRRLVNNCL